MLTPKQIHSFVEDVRLWKSQEDKQAEQKVLERLLKCSQTLMELCPTDKIIAMEAVAWECNRFHNAFTCVSGTEAARLLFLTDFPTDVFRMFQALKFFLGSMKNQPHTAEFLISRQ